MIGYRSGFGYDIHRLKKQADTQLILGGVPIASGICAEAHSDGDVLIHSLIDALLGAICDGDIGEHFPDTDPLFAKISSLNLLKKTVERLYLRKASILNIDATVILQNIRLSPFKESIRCQLASTLNISPEQVNVKAKTKENLDAVGRGEAIEAYTAALIFIEPINS